LVYGLSFIVYSFLSLVRSGSFNLKFIWIFGSWFFNRLHNPIRVLSLLISMSTTRPTIRVFCFITLFVYLLLLAKNILFKRGGPRYYKNYFAREYKHYSVRNGWEKANTVPFRTINLYKKGLERHNSTAEYNIWGNLLGFVPLGILLPLCWRRFRNGFFTVLAGALLSLFFEYAQLYTGLGIFDVDDLLLNTAGTLLGFVVFWIISPFLYPVPAKEDLALK
jgi:glycopeptide antibiotics resistance protein